MTAVNRKQHSVKRIAPGYYETANGKWEILKVSDPRDGRVWWHHRSTVVGHPFEDAHDIYDTKWEAVEAMDRSIQYCSDNGLDY